MHRELFSSREVVPSFLLSVTIRSCGWNALGLDLLERISCEVISFALAKEGRIVSEYGSEVNILFTDDDSVGSLNKTWRNKEKSTNVLSFPCYESLSGKVLPPLLGDIVLAWETVALEAKTQDIPLLNHVTHLITHGFLHLLGFDHEEERQAQEMEQCEADILAMFYIPNPYLQT